MLARAAPEDAWTIALMSVLELVDALAPAPPPAPPVAAAADVVVAATVADVVAAAVVAVVVVVVAWSAMIYLCCVCVG